MKSKTKRVLATVITGIVLFPPMITDSYGETNQPPLVRTHNPVHMLVIFTKFKGEAPGVSLAPEWAKNLFNNIPGSVSHYYDEISFGQIKVTGEYMPVIYELPRESSYYVNKFKVYARDMLYLLDSDPSVDFSRFDNDGPDGTPSSDDDDGYVDYIVLMPISRPYNFINGNATGYANLGIYETYYTRYLNSGDEFIKIDRFSGCIATASNQNQAVGTLCHEYCHSFGAQDLYDLQYEDNETDSAGIGYWGLMGHGILGWNNRDGPVAPCAYTRMILGCIGINNSNLVDIYGLHRDIRISDVGLDNGKVCRIWAGEYEYFLIEHRRNDSIYYDRQIPQNGILIWHIYEKTSSGNELMKLCDLECPDGRYIDAGYPLGKVEDPLYGGDNLDFWAHDNTYAAEHTGNLGDATDVFDGVRYTRFGTDTNPNSNSKVTNKSTGIEIFNIHPDGDEMVFDVSIPPFNNWISEKFPLIGTAFHRFMGTHHFGYQTTKETALYLLNYGHSRNPDELVTVYDDSLTVDDLSSMNYFEVQKAIEQRIFLNNMPLDNVKIIRENISFDTFCDDVINLGVSPGEICSEGIPQWIQKISIIVENQQFPETIILYQNYPNPFNSMTTITYALPAGGPVTLEVFNVLGQKVVENNRGFEHTGSHSIVLGAEGLSSGIYLYRIRGSTVSQTKKLLLIR